MEKIKHSLKIAFSHKLNFFNSVMIDTLFILLFGFISSAYLFKIQEYLDAVGIIAMSGQGINQAPTLFSIIFNPLTSQYLLMVLILVIMMFISIYFIFSILIGTTNYISYNIKHISFEGLSKYLKNFFIISIPWLLMLAIVELLSIYFYFISYTTPGSDFSRPPAQYLIWIIMILIMYFLIISSLMSRKKNFKLSFNVAIKRFTKLFPVYSLCLLFIIILSHPVIAELIASIHYVLVLIYAIFIVVPCLTIARIIFKNYFENSK
ncbi:MAG: hypothetical protein ACMXYG_06090 [Candidatus Woesearchaeota archaeon]